ncbi:hypothetical protein [Demequina subtropica]|uniref:hypothetical protein n=1 Tax=Demequina subtropica TaxID=1638989 RepID=UPI000783242C|nr:hypothetical protein [Demequina subtropica]
MKRLAHHTVSTLAPLALAIGATLSLAGCSSAEGAPEDTQAALVVATVEPVAAEPSSDTTDVAEAVVETTPEPTESAVPAPTKTTKATPKPEPVAEALSLTETFTAMLAAAKTDGVEGVVPFMEKQGHGDLWGVVGTDFIAGECSEADPAGCVAYYDYEGTQRERIFMFEKIDGSWKLTEAYTW